MPNFLFDNGDMRRNMHASAEEVAAGVVSVGPYEGAKLISDADADTLEVLDPIDRDFEKVRARTPGERQAALAKQRADKDVRSRRGKVSRYSQRLLESVLELPATATDGEILESIRQILIQFHAT